ARVHAGEVGAAVVPLLSHRGTGGSEGVLAQLFLGTLPLDGSFVVVPLQGDLNPLVERDRGGDTVDTLRGISPTARGQEALRELNGNRGTGRELLLEVTLPGPVEVLGDLQFVQEEAQDVHGHPVGV